MKYFFYLTLLFTTLYTKTFRVIDEFNDPIENAQVFNDINGFVTDKDGLFFVESIYCSEYRVSHIGFQESTFNPCNSESTITLTNFSIPSSEVKVSASLAKTKLKDNLSNTEIFTSTSVVLSDKVNLEDILTSSTNVNFSGVSSRPRYFQIRGIGEYEQYASQGGPTYYVATYIDNFNYSGLGMPASLFDVDQVEIIKGSQSYCFGQNALGGLVKIKTNKPKPFREIKLKAGVGSFDKKKFSFVLNQPLFGAVNLRIGTSKHTDRGFIFNDFIDDYSNKRDELISNVQISYSKHFSSDNQVYLLFSALQSDLDNNYDRWSYSNFDNMKDLTTHSNFGLLPNNESKDALISSSNSLEMIFSTKDDLRISAVYSASDIDLKHYYDADWSNPSQWSEDHQGDHYDFSQQEDRSRNDKYFDINVSKKYIFNEFTVGAFSKTLEEKDNALGFVFYTNGGWVSSFTSSYSIDYSSIYYQHKYKIGEDAFTIFNIRSDHYNNVYKNYLETSNSVTYEVDGSSTDILPSTENFISSRLGFKFKNFHLAFSTGHKAGGFNQNPFLETVGRQYKGETSSAVEGGYNLNNKNLFFDFNFFYIKRKNLQVDIADQADPSNPVTFYFYTANIESGYNLGIDISSNYKLSDRLNTFFNCGLLSTQRDGFSYPSPVIDPDPVLPSREQARAPKYTVSSGFEFRPTKKIFTRFEIVAKDSYYYFNNSNQKSSAYVIANISAMYQLSSHFRINMSVKNATDQRYGIHGFYFSISGYESRKFHESPANPRDFSLSLTYSL